jgi:hypothetical protein
MADARRDALVHLFRRSPRLLETQRGLPAPPVGATWTWHVEASDVTLHDSQPLQPDAVFTRRLDGSEQPELVVVFEVMCERDEVRRRNWPLYVDAATWLFQCPGHLVVVCPDQDVANWAAQPVHFDPADGRPHSLTPGRTRPPVVG